MSHVFPIDTRRLMVQTHEFEVVVGDIFRVGGTTVTVIDIDNGEVTFRIDEGDDHDEDLCLDDSDVDSTPLPR